MFRLSMLAVDYSDYYDLIESSSSSGRSSGNPAISVISTVVLVVAYWFIFMKANEPGWKSIVPFLNIWTLFELAYDAGWKMLLLFVPGLNIVLYFAFNIRLAQSFGKTWLFGLGLCFLPQIFFLILAFDGSTYHGSATNSFI